MIVNYISDVHLDSQVPFHKNQNKWEQRTKQFTSDLVIEKRKNELKKESGLLKKEIKGIKDQIMVLAGDFSHYNKQTLWFLEIMSMYYEHVFFVFGNHDYYLVSGNQLKKYQESLTREKELLSQVNYLDNVTPLVKGIVDYKGIRIAGDMLWYLPNKESDWYFYNNLSADSEYLYQKGVSKEEMIKNLNAKSLFWYNTLFSKKVDLMVSHVPPVQSPLTPFKANSCFYTTVNFLVAKYWICGHQHTKGVFHKAGTTFYMNPGGYKGELGKPVIESFEL